MGFVFAPVSVLYFKGREGSKIWSLPTLYPYFQLCPVEFLREEREVGSCLRHLTSLLPLSSLVFKGGERSGILSLPTLLPVSILFFKGGEGSGILPLFIPLVQSLI